MPGLLVRHSSGVWLARQIMWPSRLASSNGGLVSPGLFQPGKGALLCVPKWWKRVVARGRGESGDRQKPGWLADHCGGTPENRALPPEGRGEPTARNGVESRFRKVAASNPQGGYQDRFSDDSASLQRMTRSRRSRIALLCIGKQMKVDAWSLKTTPPNLCPRNEDRTRSTGFV